MEFAGYKLQGHYITSCLDPIYLMNFYGTHASTTDDVGMGSRWLRLFSNSRCNEILAGCIRRMPVHLCHVCETRNQKRRSRVSEFNISLHKGRLHTLCNAEEAPPSPLLDQGWGRRQLNLCLFHLPSQLGLSPDSHSKSIRHPCLPLSFLSN